MSKFLLFLLVAISISIAIYSPNLIRLYKLSNLYNEKTIAYNFINIDKFFFTSEPISASDEPYFFEESYIDLPDKYSLDGEEHNLIEALKIACSKFTKEKTGKKPFTNINLVRI